MAAKLRIDRTLNINFLPNMVYEPEGCLRQTMLAAARTGFPLQRLTFEIVEHEDTTELEHLRQIIATYRHHGFQIALDDYGVGYSGLLRMTELRPDIIKLDRVLVRGCDTDYRRWVMIASLIEPKSSSKAWKPRRRRKPCAAPAAATCRASTSPAPPSKPPPPTRPSPGSNPRQSPNTHGRLSKTAR
jgi:hypothetical protein